MTTVSAVIFLVSARHNMATAYIVGRVEAGEFALLLDARQHVCDLVADPRTHAFLQQCSRTEVAQRQLRGAAEFARVVIGVRQDRRVADGWPGTR